MLDDHQKGDAIVAPRVVHLCTRARALVPEIGALFKECKYDESEVNRFAIRIVLSLTYAGLARDNGVFHIALDTHEATTGLWRQIVSLRRQLYYGVAGAIAAHHFPLFKPDGVWEEDGSLYHAWLSHSSHDETFRLAIQAFYSHDYTDACPHTLGDLYQEIMRYNLETCLTHRKQGSEQLKTAAFYTPPAAVRYMVRRALSTHPLLEGETRPRHPPTILDPALGCAFFLVEAVRQIAGKFGVRDPSPIVTRCYGTDINATAIDLSRCSLMLLCRPRDDETRQRVATALVHNICVSDAIASSMWFDRPEFDDHVKAVEGPDWATLWPELVPPGSAHPQFDLVLTNPPWATLKIMTGRKLTDAQASSLKEESEGTRAFLADPKNGGSGMYITTYGSSVTTVNMYMPFFERCTYLLKPGTGEMLFLVASGIMSTHGSQLLRKMMRATMNMLRVDMFAPSTLFRRVKQPCTIIHSRRNTTPFPSRSVLDSVDCHAASPPFEFRIIRSMRQLRETEDASKNMGSAFFAAHPKISFAGSDCPGRPPLIDRFIARLAAGLPPTEIGFMPFADFAESTSGIRPERVKGYEGGKCGNGRGVGVHTLRDDHVGVIRGRHLHSYHIMKPYEREVPKDTLRDHYDFERPRVLSRKTVNFDVGRRFQATVHTRENRVVPLYMVFVHYLRVREDEDRMVYVLCALLNSKILEYIYRSTDYSHNIFLTDLRNMPVPHNLHIRLPAKGSKWYDARDTGDICGWLYLFGKHLASNQDNLDRDTKVSLMDKMDRLVCRLYTLTEAETDFIIDNYDCGWAIHATTDGYDCVRAKTK